MTHPPSFVTLVSAKPPPDSRPSQERRSRASQENPVIETIIVVLIVAAALGYAVWRFYRVATGKGSLPCCGCKEDSCDLTEAADKEPAARTKGREGSPSASEAEKG